MRPVKYNLSIMKRLKIKDKFSISLLNLLILAYSTVLQFSLPSVVLCFGDDGHIAIEQIEIDYRCADFSKHNDHFVDGCINLFHQNNECEDLPLINLFSIPFIEKESKTKNLKSTVVDDNIKTITTCSISHFDIYKDCRILLSTMKSLQTTILLI